MHRDFTTLAALIYAHAIQQGAVTTITRGHALGIGLACGLAILAVPLALFFRYLHSFSPPSFFDNSLTGVIAGLVSQNCGLLRPLTILSAATLVALPWYLLVSLRTNGQWTTDFLLIHNAGRFAAPMEGHSGSFLYYPIILAIGMFPWSIILLAIQPMPYLLANKTPDEFTLSRCYFCRMLGPCLGRYFFTRRNKTPGYIWPAYQLSHYRSMSPTGFVDIPVGKKYFQKYALRQSGAAVVHIGWLSLAVVGMSFIGGLPIISYKFPRAR